MNRRIIITLFAALALASCIKNDLPKPVVDLYIASLDVEGTSGDVVIDRSTYTATIPLAEETNIEAVKFNSVTYGADVVTNVSYDADASKIVASKELDGKVINMSQPEYIALSYFQTFEWKIVATQHINRMWSVDGQIGATEWDLEGHRAIVRRRSDRDLSNVVTDTLRFGPTSVYSYPSKGEAPTNFEKEEVWPTLTINGETLQDVSVRVATVTVSAFDNAPVVWKLVVVPTLAEPEFKHISAGANVIWVKANAIDGSKILFKYRKMGEEEWVETKESWYSNESNPYNRTETGFVKAVIRGLEQNTEYEVQGWAVTQLEDGTTSEIPSKVFSVTTSQHYQMPNSDMESWCKEGPCWYPGSSVMDLYWGTGNPGGTSLGESYNLTTPAYKSVNSENVSADSKGTTSAYMGSQNVLNMKFAAGNLFVGYYGETLGTNATVYFGRPLAQDTKPVALRFKVKYQRGTINCIGNKDLEGKRGTNDLTKIFICLTEWSAPHCVNSADPTTFFDPRTAKGVCGLGYFDSDNNPELVVEHTDEWHTMTIPVEYSNPEAVASYIVLTFTCSGYGDYFTGSSSSWMYIDDVELLYDLDDSNQPM